MKLILTLLLVLGTTVFAKPLDSNELTRGVLDDVQDFIDLLPLEKIKSLAFEYFGSDEEFQSAIDYVLSDEFTGLVEDIESMPEIRKFLDFLEELGLPAYEYVNKMNGFLEIKPISQGLSRSLRITGGVLGFIKDVRALIPEDKIKALYEQKMETSKEFAEVVNRLKSEESQNVVNNLMANPKFKNFLDRVEKRGINVREIMDFLSSLLGLHFPKLFQAPTTLKDDITDFVALLPVQKIQDIFSEYALHDNGFIISILYLHSNQFLKGLERVQKTQEFRKVLDVYDHKGVSIYELVSGINEGLGLDQLEKTPKVQLRKAGGFGGFLKEIKEVLPLEEIKKLYEKKMTDSKEFRTFVETLDSKPAIKAYTNLLKTTAVQSLIREAGTLGIESSDYFALIGTILGIKPTYIGTRVVLRSLNDDLEDFRKLVPEKKIMDVVYRYIGEDTEVQEALDYVLSDEFIGLVKDVEAMPVFKEFVKYLEDAGLPASKYIHELNQFLEIDDVKRHLTFLRATGGLKGMIEEIKTLIPEQQIRKLYEEKLNSSPEFKKLIEKLSDQKSQDVVDKLMSDDRVKNLISKLSSKGIDVQEVLDTASALLGLKFPKQN